MWQRLWQENRSFIQIAGGGLAAFLVLHWFAFRIQGRADTILEQEVPGLEKKIRTLQRQLDVNDDRERKDRALLVEKESRVLEALQVAGPDPSGPKVRSLIDFQDAWNRVYSQAVGMARKHGTDLPEKKKIVFPEPSPGDVEGFRQNEIMLGVVDQILKATTEIGFRQILALAPWEVETSPMTGAAEGEGLVAYPVRLTVVGTFDNFVDLLDRFQGKGRFLQVIIDSLKPAPGMEGLLRGDLTVAGLRLGKVEQKTAGRMEFKRYRPYRR